VEIIGLKNPKARIGSQTTIEDLPFPSLIPKVNSCTSILQRKMLSHSLTRKWPWHHLWVKFSLEETNLGMKLKRT